MVDLSCVFGEEEDTNQNNQNSQNNQNKTLTNGKYQLILNGQILSYDYCATVGYDRDNIINFIKNCYTSESIEDKRKINDPESTFSEIEFYHNLKISITTTIEGSKPKKNKQLNKNGSDFPQNKGLDSQTREEASNGLNDNEYYNASLWEYDSDIESIVNNYDKVEKIIVNGQVVIAAFGKIENKDLTKSQINKKIQKRHNKNKKVNNSYKAADFEYKGLIPYNLTINWKNKILKIESDSRYEVFINGAKIFAKIELPSNKELTLELGWVESYNTELWTWSPNNYFDKYTQRYHNNEWFSEKLNNNPYYFNKDNNAQFKNNGKGEIKLIYKGKLKATKKYKGLHSYVSPEIYDIAKDKDTQKWLDKQRNYINRNYIKYEGAFHTESKPFNGKDRKFINDKIKLFCKKRLGIESKDVIKGISNSIISYLEGLNVPMEEVQRLYIEKWQKDSVSFRDMVTKCYGQMFDIIS